MDQAISNLKRDLLTSSYEKRVAAGNCLSDLLSDDNWHSLDTSFETKQLVVSTLTSDPSFTIRNIAGTAIANYLRELSPIEAYRKFIGIIRAQKLEGLRTIDPRLEAEEIFNPELARLNQLSTLLRSLQIMANLPLADKHSEIFFDLLKTSGFVENLDQRQVSHGDYRTFIEDGFTFKSRRLLSTDIPTPFVRMCIIAIRRGHLLNAYFSGNYSLVGNRDLLVSYQDRESIVSATNGFSMRGIIYSLNSVLRRFKRDPKFIEPCIQVSRLQRFFNINFPGHSAI